MNLIVNSELFEAFTKVLHYLKIHKIDYIKTNDIKMIVKPTQTKKVIYKVRQYREKKRWTREALSAVSGVAPTTIRLIETNTSDRQNSVRLSTLISLAQALSVKVKDLFEEVKE